MILLLQKVWNKVWGHTAFGEHTPKGGGLPINLDELAASRVTTAWQDKYHVRMMKIQADFDMSSHMEQEAYTDLLYKTFPYLNKKNPYPDD